MRGEDYIRSKICSPLSERAFKIRARLLSLSVLSVVVAYTNLLPTQIEGLGISFETLHHQRVVQILIFSLCYFLVSFALTAVTDFYIAKLARKSHLEDELSKEEFFGGDFEQIRSNFQELIYPLEVESNIIEKLQFYRVLLDVWLPIVMGVFAIVIQIFFLNSL